MKKLTLQIPQMPDSIRRFILVILASLFITPFLRAQGPTLTLGGGASFLSVPGAIDNQGGYKFNISYSYYLFDVVEIGSELSYSSFALDKGNNLNLVAGEILLGYHQKINDLSTLYFNIGLGKHVVFLDKAEGIGFYFGYAPRLGYKYELNYIVSLEANIKYTSLVIPSSSKSTLINSVSEKSSLSTVSFGLGVVFSF